MTAVSLDRNQTVWQRIRARLAAAPADVALDELTSWMLPYVVAEREDAAKRFTRSDARLIRGVVRDVVETVRGFEITQAPDDTDGSLKESLIEVASRLKIDRHPGVRRDQDDQRPGVSLADRQGFDVPGVDDRAHKSEQSERSDHVDVNRQVVNAHGAVVHGSPSVGGPDVGASVLADEPIVGAASGESPSGSPDASQGGAS
ncbi:hypothetical protein [Microbacterium sp. KR10-403]|uniref:hypothetical protein n=1 Tax=Microbacterium sp. KR10-403 TaxID=3158581 RepID=UPI0032E4D478